MIVRRSPATLLVLLSVLWSAAASATQPANPTACGKVGASSKAFLSRFTDDKPFQRSRLVLPLVARFGNYLTGDASVELWPLGKIERMKDPLIYSSKDQKS